MKTKKDFLDEKIASSPWAYAGIGAGLASLLGAASYHVFKGAAPSEDSPPVDQKGKDMTPLENALLNLVPLLIDAKREAEKDRDYWKAAHEKECARADALNERIIQAQDKVVRVEEAVKASIDLKDEIIGDLRAELQNLQRLYPAKEYRSKGVPPARRPGARRSNKEMT